MRLSQWLFCFLLSGCHCFEPPWHTGYIYHRPVVVVHHDEPQENHHHGAKPPAMPRDVMVDVINDLGLKLLAIHNEHNENNIAISPYGALCVLVALTEGLQGQAAWEIDHATQIPKDRSIARVGLRDIHRHLKSYFIPEEGFLAGLTLNHDDVPLKPEYLEILKFYGYDYATFNNALYPEPLTTGKPETTTIDIRTPDMVDSTTLTSKTTEEQTTTILEEVTELTTPAVKINNIVTTTETSTTLKSLQTTLKPTVITEESILTTTSSNIDTSAKEDVTTTNPPTTMESSTMLTTEKVETSTVSSSTTDSNEKVTTVKISPATSENFPATTISSEDTTIMSTSMTLASNSTETQIGGTQPFKVTSQHPDNEITTVETTTMKMSTTSSEVTSTVKTTELPTTERTTPVAEVTTVTENSTPEMTLTFTTAGAEMTAATSPFPDTTTSATLVPKVPFDPNTQFGNINAADQFGPDQPQFVDEINTQPPPVGDFGATEIPFFGTMAPGSVDPTMQPPANMFDYPFYPDVNTAFENGDPSQNFVDNTRNANQFVGENVNTNVKRKARSIVDYLIARYYDEHQISNHQPYGGSEPNHPPRYQHNLQHSYRGYTPEEPLSFLVYGKYREAKINFMRYDTVLPFQYVPHLNALALSFPLDSTKYYLLLLLPVEEDGIDQLVCDLRLHGSLRYIIENLKLQRVVATIPSFTLKGYVILTPTFQKLGIQKVFEPRQADFSLMTNETEIYVTNIEQAVTVTIRNYVDPSSEYNNKDVLQYEPVHFKADHPFLYFVIDAEFHVALMEGKVVNPLNSRIR